MGARIVTSATSFAAYVGRGTSAVEHWRASRDKNRCSLAALDDSHLSDLSDVGRRIRREQRARLWETDD
jgi:hypothetical protein